MVGLIKAWLAIEYGISAKIAVPTPESRDRFFDAVFRGWHSGVTHEIAPPPEFPKRKKLWESSVEGGTWIQDLFGDTKQDEPAESPTKKRKRQVEDNQGSPKKMRQDQKDARRSSAKAFLSVIVNEKSGEPRWQWRDICGQAAPNDLVKFREGLILEGWKILCLKNYDYHEQRLTKSWSWLRPDS
ncbi:hypothetical protein NCS57_00372700 [Fusarium keratoplasticum]|uniref:Uncharacterized protein n=1 Tax=Fusarium keratoplasticum TaxID=1328300 RepID=A0ACC0R4C7_9HYPO|nr:hypothetical protein NCS57_00372700 [Fusarium keratoplasticum]KAI8674739.1 hypothetical protein NCS57_00372700 [Fusarium keratoplasticum]